MAALGVRASLQEVAERYAAHFANVFDCELLEETPALAASIAEREN